jgi:DNA repair exonuclease SbcCD ATPase subunit
MSSDYDASDFIDGDLQSQKSPSAGAGAKPGSSPAQRAPTREEVDSELAKTQQRLSELLREKEEKERERAAWEETRRRQAEFQTGRAEMLQSLTRGVGLLEEAEFNSRRDAEQMAKALIELRDALDKVQSIHEETWTRDNFSVELTRALTTLENARMEWTTARLKFAVLAGAVPQSESMAQTAAPVQSLFGIYSFGELCRLGFALTWPVAAVLLALAVVLAVLLHH